MYRTRGHPAFAERLIRTFNHKLFKRVEADEKKGKQTIQWTNNFLKQFKQGKRKDTLRAKVNTPLKAKKDRLHPELLVGDKVKILRKALSLKKKDVHTFTRRVYCRSN